VKAADSPWKCNDRGNAWLKIKPDYLQVRMTAARKLCSALKKHWIAQLRLIATSKCCTESCHWPYFGLFQQETSTHLCKEYSECKERHM